MLFSSRRRGEESIMKRLASAEGRPELEQYADGFVAELGRLGYSPRTGGAQAALLRHLARWLAARHVPLSGLGSEVADEYIAARGRSFLRSGRALGPLLGYLRRAAARADARPGRGPRNRWCRRTAPEVGAGPGRRRAGAAALLVAGRPDRGPARRGGRVIRGPGRRGSAERPQSRPGRRAPRVRARPPGRDPGRADGRAAAAPGAAGLRDCRAAPG